MIKSVMVLGAGLLAGVPASSIAQAAYVVAFEEVGSDVVATGSGSIDLTDLIGNGSGGARGFVAGFGALEFTGPTSFASYDGYVAAIGPSSFGGSDGIFADLGSGSIVGIGGLAQRVFVPSGYTSGAMLFSSSTYLNQTFATLDLHPGTYVFGWGIGDHADTFTVEIGVPEPSTWAMMLIGFAGLAFAGYRSTRKRAAVERLAG
jgi:hypothetical protein